MDAQGWPTITPPAVPPPTPKKNENHYPYFMIPVMIIGLFLTAVFVGGSLLTPRFSGTPVASPMGVANIYIHHRFDGVTFTADPGTGEMKTFPAILSEGDDDSTVMLNMSDRRMLQPLLGDLGISPSVYPEFEQYVQSWTPNSPKFAQQNSSIYTVFLGVSQDGLVFAHFFKVFPQ